MNNTAYTGTIGSLDSRRSVRTHESFPLAHTSLELGTLSRETSHLHGFPCGEPALPSSAGGGVIKLNGSKIDKLATYKHSPTATLFIAVLHGLCSLTVYRRTGQRAMYLPPGMANAIYASRCRRPGRVDCRCSPQCVIPKGFLEDYFMTPKSFVLVAYSVSGTWWAG